MGNRRRQAQGEWPAPDQAGFTLIEVLVAFALLALALAVALPQIGEGLNGTAAAEQRANALLYAETKLTMLKTDPDLKAGESEGDLPAGYRWRATVSRYGKKTQLGFEAPPVTAWQIAVTVRWPGAREGQGVRLVTVHLLPEGER